LPHNGTAVSGYTIFYKKNKMAKQNYFIEFLKDIADTSELKDIFTDLLSNHESWIESATKNKNSKMADAYKTLAPIFEKMNKNQKSAMVTLLENEYYNNINHFLEKIDDDRNIAIGYHDSVSGVNIVDNVSSEFDKVYFKKKKVKFEHILNRKKYILVEGDSEDFCRSEEYYELFRQLMSISQNDITFEIINNSTDKEVNIRFVSGDVFVDFKKSLENDCLEKTVLKVLNSFVQKISINDKRYAFVYPDGIQNSGQEFCIAFIEETLFFELLSNDFTSLEGM
jgi:hypothetical protein